MEALDCIKTRRSIRQFKTEAVDHDTINAIIEAASMSPSFKNAQTTRYTIIENWEIIDDIAENCLMDYEFNQRTVRRAPQLVVVSIIEKNHGYGWDGRFFTSKEGRWEMFDAGISAQTFCLAAHDMGVGTSFIGILDEEMVAKAINLPEEQKVTALIAMGYPDEECEAPPRMKVDELVRYV